MPNNFFITTPIYYVNDVPHIGHAYTSIATDFIARFKRMSGVDTIFLTGTDEHGQKIQKAAENNLIEPLSLCDKNSEKFRELTEVLNLSNDDFIRTTEKRHIDGAKSLWNKLMDNGDIYLDTYKGWYSVSDETFYNEKDLNKQQDGSFKTITGGPVDWIEEESYFFKLSKYSEKLLDLYEKNSDFILPKSRKNEVVSFVKSGLRDLSISRNTFNWGINVPKDEKHVMYVWLDALSSYPNSLGYIEDKNSKLSSYWLNSTHIVGKDILRHHAVYWPAFLMSAKLDLPKRIFAHGWWTNEGNKISKSLGNAIDPIEIIDKFGLDQIRYFLLREITFGSDGDFSIDALKSRINADLSNDLGNLCQRSLTMIVKHCDATVPSNKNVSESERKFLSKISNELSILTSHVNNQEINIYIKKLWDIIGSANKYFNDNKPWELKNTDKKNFNNVLYVTAEIIKQIGIMIYPVMPDTSVKILNFYNIKSKNISLNMLKIDLANTKINEIKPLFPRVE
jgi:methionyl-tRNA synthetase